MWRTERTPLEEILAKHANHREDLISVLQEIQDLHGYISRDAINALAGSNGISENEIYGVATFYSQFRFQPPAEHTIHVCEGTACHVRGGHRLLNDIVERLDIKPGEMTSDGRFALERVACVGCCALAPVVVVDGKVHAGMQPKKVRGLLGRFGRNASGARA